VLSPDGAMIAFSAMNASSPDTNDIWVAHVDGSHAQKVASLPALQHEPAWSASGNTLYFLSGPGGQSHDIYTVDVQGKKLEQLTVGELYHFDISVAPDATLAFSSNRRDGN
jgi:TolB protein